MTTVRIYKSTDTGAPTLSGTAGALIGVLDACLVNGYNTNNPAGAGWTKAHSGTNLAAYQPASGSNQFKLKVRDDGPGAGTGLEARVRGLETMTQVTATNDGTDGTNLFPTVAQVANGIFVRKSNTLDATYRPWIVAADERTFYMWMNTGDATTGVWNWWGFGEFYSFKTSDPGRTFIFARNGENTSASANDPDRIVSIQNTGGFSPGAQYLARDHAGGAGSMQCAFGGRGDFSTSLSSNSLIGWTGICQSANPIDHKYHIAPVRVHNASVTNTNFRGRLRGLWHWQHLNTACCHGQTFTGNGSLAGKTFMIIKGSVNSTGSSNAWVVETSSTWDTN